MLHIIFSTLFFCMGIACIGLESWCLNNYISIEEKPYKKWVDLLYRNDILVYVGVITMVVAGAILIIAVPSALVTNIDYNISKREVALVERREAIIFKIEQGLYKDKLDLNDNMIVDSITEFNTEIKENREIMKSPWLGIFIGEEYNNVDPIDLNIMLEYK